MDRPAFAKPEVTKDPDYLAWIRQQPCIVCITVPPGTIPDNYRGYGVVAPHHTVRHNDHKTLPMCFNHHRAIHDLPESKWKELFLLGKKHFIAQCDNYYKKYLDLLQEEI